MDDEYKIIVADDVQEMEALVGDRLDKGATLAGSLSVVDNGNGTKTFYQAVMDTVGW